jgi:hypothetical protein
MILEGWPETGSLPGGATKTCEMRADKSKMKADESRRVTIIIGELEFSSNLGFQNSHATGHSVGSQFCARFQTGANGNCGDMG